MWFNLLFDGSTCRQTLVDGKYNLELSQHRPRHLYEALLDPAIK